MPGQWSMTLVKDKEHRAIAEQKGNKMMEVNDLETMLSGSQPVLAPELV